MGDYWNHKCAYGQLIFAILMVLPLLYKWTLDNFYVSLKKDEWRCQFHSISQLFYTSLWELKSTLVCRETWEKLAIEFFRTNYGGTKVCQQISMRCNEAKIWLLPALDGKFFALNNSVVTHSVSQLVS